MGSGHSGTDSLLNSSRGLFGSIGLGLGVFDAFGLGPGPIGSTGAGSWAHLGSLVPGPGTVCIHWVQVTGPLGPLGQGSWAHLGLFRQCIYISVKNTDSNKHENH